MNENAAVLSGHTFLLSLVTDHSTFADEIDKFNYLKSLKGIMNNSGCSGISFVLTDDVLKMILFSENEDINPGEQILAGFHQVFVPYYQDRYPRRSEVHAQAEMVKLEEEQLLDESLRLHMVPKEQGFVQWAADYFWSSAQTYLGRYSWDFIEQDLLLSLINSNSVKARKELNRYAREKYFEEFGAKFGYSR